MTELSARQTRNPELPSSSSVPFPDLFLGSAEFNSLVALVNSQLVCLLLNWKEANQT